MKKVVKLTCLTFIDIILKYQQRTRNQSVDLTNMMIFIHTFGCKYQFICDFIVDIMSKRIFNVVDIYLSVHKSNTIGNCLGLYIPSRTEQLINNISDALLNHFSLIFVPYHK